MTDKKNDNVESVLVKKYMDGYTLGFEEGRKFQEKLEYEKKAQADTQGMVNAWSGLLANYKDSLKGWSENHE